jgi:7-cyano-7-deazaguanine reductase
VAKNKTAKSTDAKPKSKATAKGRGQHGRISDTTGVTMLGSVQTGPSGNLEAFPFRHQRDTLVTFICKEFTCVCPVTGQPDFASIDIEYVPDSRALESKSLKNYLWTYRNVPGFHEDVVNKILSDLAGFLEPKWLKVTGHFWIRGGIAIDVAVQTGPRPDV